MNTTPFRIRSFLACDHMLLLLILLSPLLSYAQQQDPTTMNGGSILAMAGKNCIALAVDKRFGSGPQLINVSPRTVLMPHSRSMIGLVGLEGDVQSLCREVSIELSNKRGRHMGFGFGLATDASSNSGGISMVAKEMEIEPRSLSLLLSHLLYRRRGSPYYVEPIVVGLEKRIVVREPHSESPEVQYIPYLCAQDVIGAQSTSASFVCSGAASKSLHGTAEALWRPDLSPEELLHVCGRAFLSALERDCLSGYGAIIYLMVGGEGIEECDLSCRND